MRATFALVWMSPTVILSPHLNNSEFKIPLQRRHENVAQKVNLGSFNLYRDYSNSPTLSNASELF